MQSRQAALKSAHLVSSSSSSSKSSSQEACSRSGGHSRAPRRLLLPQWPQRWSVQRQWQLRRRHLRGSGQQPRSGAGDGARPKRCWSACRQNQGAAWLQCPKRCLLQWARKVPLPPAARQSSLVTTAAASASASALEGRRPWQLAAARRLACSRRRRRGSCRGRRWLPFRQWQRQGAVGVAAAAVAVPSWGPSPTPETWSSSCGACTSAATRAWGQVGRQRLFGLVCLPQHAPPIAAFCICLAIPRPLPAHQLAALHLLPHPVAQPGCSAQQTGMRTRSHALRLSW